MNAKFSDMTSKKNSAKHEFNQLVQTLTLASAKEGFGAETDSNEQSDPSENSEPSDQSEQSNDQSCASESQEDQSNDSSFDEETLSLNHKNLQQFFRDKKHAEKNNQDHSNSKKYQAAITDKNGFSKSRYQNVDEDGDDEQLEPFYDDKSNGYMVPEGRIDLNSVRESQNQMYSQDTSDKLYQDAKNSLNRTKCLLLASQHDNEFLNEMSYEESSKNENEILNLSSKRVKNILRNKQKRQKMKQVSNSNKKKFQQFATQNDDSDSCKILVSTELEQDNTEESKESFKHNITSRNYIHSQLDNMNRRSEQNFVQTTSSGNLVLYDSSCQSPQEMMDPEFIENKITHQHMKVYDHPQAYELNSDDDQDTLQNDKIAGKPNSYCLDEQYPHYYMRDESDDVGDLDDDCRDYDEDDMSEEVVQPAKKIHKYVQQLSGSKFKH